MKTIIATNNPDKYALVDDDVYETIKEMGLKFCIKPNGYFYSTKRIKLPGMIKKKYLLLHHFVYILKTGIESKSTVDHIDRDPGNNKFENLRLATQQQQKQNRGKRKDNTSGYIGVIFFHDKRRKKNNDYWKVQISNPDDGKLKQKTFPYTDDGLIAAAKYYDQKAIEYHGEFAVTNFPNDNKTA